MPRGIRVHDYLHMIFIHKMAQQCSSSSSSIGESSSLWSISYELQRQHHLLLAFDHFAYTATHHARAAIYG
uniref:Uncharacterized protein n=1 Tax=Trichogramma kaykai TaxID=54128 RepID=A0ABD2WSI5_9HYME